MATMETKAKELQKNFEQIIYQFQTVAAENLEAIDKINPKEMNTIIFIGKKKVCIMREIAAFLNVADSTVTMLVDKLVKKRLVKREHSEEDRRIINIILDDEGKKLYQEHLNSYRKLCRGILMTLDEKEQDLYVDLMTKIAGNAKEQFAKS